ncbi:hypothetical protein K466DRAFT_145628 [Polyporus arcularius HHB13444]|uniref:MYND-type domain-containing protein n=1 Tax=Polyporus arcularius HHB13444 TaxID=1314778 RepID=A0A5C3PWQ9_9APHY|nr:hypothetical protein K466DRAFT_145628 [Polyporus arcularius HHB13444]
MGTRSRNNDATNHGLYDLYVDFCRTVNRLPLEQAYVYVRRRLGIPNAMRRKGLRKLHMCLPVASRKLSYIFDLAASQTEWDVCATIEWIWLEICADAMLCHGLLEDGLLSRVLPLIDAIEPSILLQLLAVLATHGDDSVKSEILRHLPAVLIKWDPWMCDEIQCSEFLLVTLCHCIGVATFPADPVPMFPPHISVTFVADVALEALQHPEASHDLIIHAIPLLILCAKACVPEEIRTRQRILDFLALLLHSNEPSIRAVATWVFCGLPPAERKSTSNYASRAGSVELVDLTALARCDAPPESERRAIRNYTLTVRKLLQALHDDGDFETFGIGLSTSLWHGPFIYSDDDFANFKDGALARFNSWDSVLLEAAEVLRRFNLSWEISRADTLTLEHLARSGPPDAAAAHAREVLKRNSHHVYAALILCEWSGDREEALQAALNGLGERVPGVLTPYLRRRLYAAAIELAQAKAQTLLLQTGPSDRRRRFAGFACLDSMADYDRVLIPTAPSDAREFLHMTDLAIIHLLLTRAHIHTPDQLEDTLYMLSERVALLVRTLENSGFKIVEGSYRAKRRALVHHFTNGFAKWAELVERFDHIDAQNRAFWRSNLPKQEEQEHSGWPHEEQYARWWEPENEPTFASLLRGPLRCSCHSSEDGGIQMGPGLALLYACSWCFCRSVIVRKCSRCQDAWYCDSTCQRAHWPQHRMACLEYHRK